MATPPPPKAEKPQNPALKAMGLPSRLRLPSRNWVIFWTVVSTWTGMWYYDRRERKRIQEKWCKAVEHIAKEPLDPKAMSRKLTLYMMAPPGDDLNSTIEWVREYVKPILTAGGIEWEVIDGRREGEVRRSIADKVRAARKRSGLEPFTGSADENLDIGKELVENYRKTNGIFPWPGIKGDIVIGRHTWKEYIRGLHEGYLGPLDDPLTLQSATELSETSTELSTNAEGGEEEVKKEEKEEKKPDEKPKRAPVKAAYLPATEQEYSSRQLSPSTPELLGPVSAVPHPHLLGFRNTPRRIYRFFTRRFIADKVGAQVAAAVLGSYEHDWRAEPSETAKAADVEATSQQALEFGGLLHANEVEEPDWPKHSRERKPEDESERVWLDTMVIDERIISRLPKFVLPPGFEDVSKPE